MADPPGLGFAVRRIPLAGNDANRLEPSPSSSSSRAQAAAVIVPGKGGGKLPIYVRKSVNHDLSEEDAFRIGKILETYRARPEITQTGAERRGVIDSLVDRYTSLAKGRIGPERARLYKEICFSASGDGLGPLDFLMEDPEIEEILANGPGEPVYVFHRKAGMCETNLSFLSGQYLVEKANQMLFPLNRRVDEGKPASHGILPNGDRVSVAVPPLSRRPCIDIRRFSEEPLTAADLALRGMLNWEMAAFLSLVMGRGGTNLGVVGNTGAGKTTLLNALLRFIPPHQRIVSVEEIPEIKIPHSHQVRLVEVEHLGLGMADCILETLRLRPDRVVVGEVRTPAEALALRDSCLSGQSFGTYFTYHSESPALAVGRLVSQGVSRRDCAAFGMLVSCRRFEDGNARTVRVVSEISEVAGEGAPRRLFAYDFAKRRWSGSLKGKSRAEKWISASLFGGRGLGKELRRREALLKGLAGKRDEEFFRMLWEAK